MSAAPTPKLLAGSAAVLIALLADRPGVTGSLHFGLDQAVLLAVGSALLAWHALDRRKHEEEQARLSLIALGGTFLAVAAFGAHRAGAGPPRLVWWSYLGVLAGAAVFLAASPALRGAIGRAARRVPIALAGLLVLGVGLRVWFVVAHNPGFIGYPDTNSYLNASRAELFTAAYRTAGYPEFLRLARHLHQDLQVVVVIQHLLGLASAGLLYAATRRLGCGRGFALIPAAAVLVGGTQIYLEHAVLSESVFTFVVVAALYAASRFATAGHIAWMALAGALAGLSATVRSAGVVVIPALALWPLFAGRDLRGRLLPAAATALAGLVVLGAYLGVQERRTGSASLTRAAGFTLYARTAPFADCRRFDPPAAVATVCEGKPPEARRLTPVEYMFLPGVPVRALPVAPEPGAGAPKEAFRWPPDEPLGRFARQAIVHQPLDYLKSVGFGLANTAFPPMGRSDYSSVGPRSVGYENGTSMVALLRDSGAARGLEAAAFYEIGAYWDSPRAIEAHGPGALDAYARAITFEGPLTLLLSLAALAGLVAGRSRRRELALPSLMAAALIVAPVAFLVPSARYHAPAYPFVAAAGALGLSLLLSRPASGGSRSPGARGLRRP